MQRKIQTAKTIITALPYIKKFTKKTIVIKYGGAAQINPDLKEKFAQDLVLLYLVGIRPVVVHGGGKRINELLDKLQLGTEFVDGMRVTDEKVMEVVEMVLSGSINKEITTLLNHHGAKAIGISGKDANFLKATPLENGKYGLVGEITDVDHTVLENLMNEKFIPVIAPIGSGGTTEHPGYNINADLAASKIAVSLKAEKVLFLTDTPGILDKEGHLLSSLTAEEVEALKADGTLYGGMLPKVSACMEAVSGGVKHAHIIDGRVEHSILLELFTDEGVGTVFSQ
ncbi:acetylglutamate kinase [Sulfurospirillum sp. T05]|uniref:Acetylglutamate kinase n=1 Tax=Sulfurospirillum tamanense TaxID=2813362 RepID=A0ABS2WR95_9BACT|nr:acetylglutamate kinase [Sulfurospirillum tamanensis]MBN2963744.1 acetylglutamate kinase [Sulfurospirillum tamanensis]